jgi:hypothetical protein
LMRENRSFDHMLGCFKQVYANMERIDPHPGGQFVAGQTVCADGRRSAGRSARPAPRICERPRVDHEQ